MPACLQAVSTEATFWNSPRASPRTSTPRSLYCRRAAASRVVSWSSVTGRLVQGDRAVAEDVDFLAGGRRGERPAIDDLGHAQPDLPLVVDESRSQHEEDDQQEHDVEHRRQVQRRFVVEMGFQRHGGRRIRD